jgi:hypothetical protein
MKLCSRLYQSEERFREIYSCTSTVVGNNYLPAWAYFALAAFVTEQRIKEIGIRKVLGASVSGNHNTSFKRFFKVGDSCCSNCFTCCVVGHE